MQRFTFLFSCCTAIAASALRAEDGKPGPVWTVTAECQMVTVPQKAALELIPNLLDNSEVDAAWEKLQKMIDSGEATLEADIIAKGNSGQRFIAETIEEMRYATEYEPPQIPDRVPEKDALEVLKSWPVVGITPTAYETRNVGAIMEIEPTVSADGKWITANVAPQHVRFREWAKFDAGRLANGEHLFTQQPYFHTMKNTSIVHVRNGQRTLLGVHKMPAPEKTFELFLLQIKATSSAVQ